MAFNNKARSRSRKSVVFTLVFMIVFSAFSVVAPQTLRSVAAQGEVTEYKFINASSGTSNIRLVGDPTAEPHVTYDQEMGALVDARQLGLSRSFEFDVPENGYYQISFQGYREDRVGIWDLYVDGNKIGQYDFYAPSFGIGPQQSYATMELKSGTHQFKLTSVGKNTAAIDGWSNHGAYPHKLVLTKQPAVEYRFFDAQSASSNIRLVGSPAAVPHVGFDQEMGALVDARALGLSRSFEIDVAKAGYYQVTFQGFREDRVGIWDLYMDNQWIGTYDFYAPSFGKGPSAVLQTVALTSGTHTFKLVSVAKNSAAIDGGSNYGAYPHKLALIPKASLPVQEYNFYDASNGVSNIRLQGDRTASPIVGYDQEMGALVDARALGLSRSFAIDVAEKGYYQVSFQGFRENRVGIWDLYVDGIKAGRYDFYAPSFGKGPNVAFRTFELTGGTHIFSLTSVGKNASAIDGGSNYGAYPHKLTLTGKPALPTFETGADAVKLKLLVGEQSQLQPYVQWSDGYRPDPSETVVYQYASSNPAAATVNSQGKISAVAAGTTNITVTATLGSLTAQRTWSVQVVGEHLNGASLELSPNALTLNNTAKLIVRGTLTDQSAADLTGAVIVYQSDNPAIASVDAGGVPTGHQLGQTTLRASVTLAGVTVNAQLSVTVGPNVLGKAELTLEGPVVETQVVKPTVKAYYDIGTPVNLSQAQVVFSSANNQILSPKANSGYFKALAQGTTTITVSVTLGGVTKTSSQTVTVGELKSDKTRSTYYTAAKVANARQNVLTYDWAATMRNSAVASADQYLAQGYDFIWHLVPPQTLPRSYGVNQALGSPISGKQIDQFGSYPYLGDPYAEPWKIIDPSAKDANGQYYRYPTNDFGAYYNSGLDAQGIFRPELANRSLLVNVLYPEKGPTWGVDDGYGWVDANGNRYTFIAYYTHWMLWFSGSIEKELASFRDAYIYTGDAKYAKAGLILLDRIADIYPTLSAKAYDGSVYLRSGINGRAVGSIWESGLSKGFASAYDAFYPATNDPSVMTDVIAFLSAKGEQYNLSFKTTAKGIRKNIEDGILREINKAVRNADIYGNMGFHQSTLAMAAVVLDTLPETKDWLDFVLRAGGYVPSLDQTTGGHILAGLVNDIDRDGEGNEGSPGYNSEWLQSYSFLGLADILQGYDKYPQADLYQNVKLKKMFMSKYQMMMAERYTPTIGDTGFTGNPLLEFNINTMRKAFDVYQDPLFAQLLYFLNHNRTEGLKGDIFSANPDGLAASVAADIAQYGPLNLGSTNMAGFGLAALRDGTRTQPSFGTSHLFTGLTVSQHSAPYSAFQTTNTVQLEAESAGQSITFAVPVTTGGTYELYVRPWRDPSYGKYGVYVDNQFLKEIDFNGYLTELESIGTLALTTGTHQLSFRYAGTTSASGGFKMGVTELRLRNTSGGAAPVGTDTLRDAWMYYGINDGHGHRDTLNLGLHAFGLDLAPDLGYPEYSDGANRSEWVANTVSHNTVVVDKKKQLPQKVALPQHFDDRGEVKLMDVAAPNVYTQTSAYRRTTAMIKVEETNSYTVDFFKVKGGTDHHFSFHAGEGTAAVEGLTLTAQATGTYAGSQVGFGQRADDVAGANYMGSGFHWLKNVRKTTNPAQQFSVDWQMKDTWNMYNGGAGANTNTHLRLTMLGALSDVALATGLPPQNKPGNPSELTYLLAHRNGTNLDSLFTSVIEPYKGARFIGSISPAVVRSGGTIVDNADVKAVKVTLNSGRVDYIVYSLDPNTTYTIDNKIQFRGFFGVYSEAGGVPVYRYVNDGSFIAPVSETPVQATAALQGTVVDFTKTLSASNSIDVQMSLSGVAANELVGRWIYIETSGVRNGAYEIKGVTSLGGNTYRLNVGDATPILTYRDYADFSQGFIYGFATGASFRIPLSNEQSS
ncbi:Ig-like domain-containing protein [Cohnella soli]|uniref:Ig-like domain-containing protein n=1 Tax=Cohnella soli TaxID=425005 RepID=A0ABW0I8C4_9BACL